MTDFTYFTCTVTTKQTQQNCLLSKTDPCSPVGPVAGVLGRGQAEVTQVVLLLFHLPRSDWADDADQT